MYLKIKAGAVDTSRISISSDEDFANAESKEFDQLLKNESIHEIDNFNNLLNQVKLDDMRHVAGISRWLNTVFGKTT